MKKVMLHSRILRLQSLNNFLLKKARKSLDATQSEEELFQIRGEIEQREKIETELQKIIEGIENTLLLPHRLATHSLSPLLKAEKLIYNQFFFSEASELERKNIRLYYELLYNHKLPLSITKQLLQQKQFLEYKLPE
jgi:hypothetical protein